MTKVVGSYPSVVRGVSEQVPQDRLPGQHTEQVNMVSDPVRGVARRHGSVMMDEKSLGIGPLTEAQLGYIRNYREFSFFVNGTEYMLIYQSEERTEGDDLPFAYCVNKDTGKFLTVAYWASSPGALDDWIYGGLSAITSVGQFVAMASNKVGPGYSVNDRYEATKGNGVVWIRGGAYSRTYSVTARIGANSYTTSYTTMASSYPTLLDTSDIPASASDYQKQVNDRVYAYNSAVTKWIGDANASVQPQNIANQLYTGLLAAGMTGSNVGVVSGNVVFAGIDDLSATDSGDGTLARVVFREVDDPAKLSTLHYDGKVVRVKPKGTDESYYMVAHAEAAGSGPRAVQWVEGPAQIVTPGEVFALGALSDDGNTFHIANNAATLATAIGHDVPGYQPSSVGGIDDKGGVPYFFGKRITMMTVFMDRMVIVANGTILMSRVGDYFNWFRKSMLRLDDDDPIEAYALGAEDDIIKKQVTYNKDLFMFGERKQYTISGRQILTPTNVAVSITSNERDSVYAQPVVVGNLLFYGKYEAAPNQTGPSPYSTNVSQFQLGLFQDTPETYRVTPQLDKYIRGRPIEFQALPSPHSVFVRTDGLDNGFYVYRFIDQAGTQQRQFDSWSRWEWDENGMGKLVGLSIYKATLYAVVIRDTGSGPWVGLEQFVMDSNLSSDPYLDSLRLTEYYLGNTGFYKHSDEEQYSNLYVAASLGSDVALLGENAADFDAFYEDVLEDGTKPGKVGVGYDAYVEPTSPYVRDQNDKAIVNGRLIVNRLTLSVTDTGGLDVWRTDTEGTRVVSTFNGRRVGISNNRVGMQPVTTTTINVGVGRANTEYSLKLASRRWLPFTLSGIEWVGQFFNRARRV